MNGQQPSVNSRQPVVVIGGGIAGLLAATLTARAGHPAVLLEKASGLGGRAATHEKHGFFFNLGPHALYRAGALRSTLRKLGIDPAGGIPGGSGGFAISRGRRHTLPIGFASLVTTGLLPLPAKLEFARLLAGIGSIDASAVQREPLTAWLEANVRHAEVRDLLRMLVRVATFTNDPDRQSAGAALEQLHLAAKGNVLYLHGGWQTIVDALRRSALAHGVRIVTGAHAAAIERGGSRLARGVRLADGSFVPAAALVLTGTPSDVDRIAGTSFAASLTPVRVATLDLALRAVPNPKRRLAFGVDEPLYFSLHSAVARLAPAGGGLLHVSKYLAPDEQAGRDVEAELERLVDGLQPGWREAIDTKQYLPNLTVTHAELTASTGGAAGRPSPKVASFDNVFVAGDWVGARGQLSDAAAASATEAARLALTAAVEGRPIGTAALKGCTTNANAGADVEATIDADARADSDEAPVEAPVVQPFRAAPSPVDA